MGITQWLQDFRYAARSVAKRPSYAAITIVVLAIAIGANTTVFSVLDGLFLQPLPYPDGDRLVEVYDSYPKMSLTNAGTAIPDYLERREAPALESLGIYTSQGRTLGGDGNPERVVATSASPSLFTVLRAAPELGRSFSEAEATIGNDRVAVLSDRLWRARFGASPNVLGRDVELDGVAYRVIGVMPHGFGFPSRTVDVWTPFSFTPAQASDAARGSQFSASIGRLRPGATVAELDAELEAIVQRNVASGRLPRDTVDVAGFTGRAQPLRDVRVGNLEPMVLTLQATVLAVLLIACANLANLQLTRAAGRRKELAVRAALGAEGRRLVRLVLAESLLLALAGAAAGLGIAAGGLDLVRALGLDPANQGFDFRIDPTVLAFTLGTAVLAALVAGVPPIVALRGGDLARGVRESGRSSSASGTRALRGALVIVQVAASVALLTGAGLLTKNFYRLQSEGTGFDASRVWTAGLALPAARYPSPEARVALERQALEALQALPGVADAGFTSVLPFSGASTLGSFVIDAYTPPPGAPPLHAQYQSINERYLAALGIPLLEGRNFAASEAERVAIVDTNVANRYWPGESALGRRLRLLGDPPDQWYTIVGVVPAVKQTNLAAAATKDTIYWHYAQRPVALGRFALRTTLQPEQLAAAAKRTIAALDPGLVLYNADSLDSLVRRSLGPERAPLVLTLVFAAVAFTLAVIGVYGVLTWAVTQRFAEIGVRIALGARSRDVVRMVLAQGGRLVGIGLAIGLVGAAVLGRALAGQITGVAAFDPTVLAIAAGGLGAAALLATLIPARRAARTDPMRALREE